MGQTAEISADILNGETVQGEVISISPTGEEKGGGSSERVIPTKIRILEDNTRLIAGITAKAQIILEEAKDALSVPVSAILSVGEETYVQAVNGGMIHWIPITVGVEGDVECEIIPAEGEVLDETTFDCIGAQCSIHRGHGRHDGRRSVRRGFYVWKKQAFSLCDGEPSRRPDPAGKPRKDLRHRGDSCPWL